jgi:hypothetical protein
MPLIATSIDGAPRAIFDLTQTRGNNCNYWEAAPPNRQPEHSCAPREGVRRSFRLSDRIGGCGAIYIGLKALRKRLRFTRKAEM